MWHVELAETANQVIVDDCGQSTEQGHRPDDEDDPQHLASGTDDVGLEWEHDGHESSDKQNTTPLYRN